MKMGWKVGVLVLVLLLAVAVALAFAAGGRGMRGGGGGMRGGGMRGGGGGGMGRGGGMGMMTSMHGAVLTSAVAATGDSVYVLVGNQLMKYDTNLSLVKQVDVAVDYAKMRQMMDEMRKQMPATTMQQAPPE